MSQSAYRVLVWNLVGCLLVLNGLMYPETVAHAAHHAHHHAATHGTALCAWVCAAGQALESIESVFTAELLPYVFAHIACTDQRRGSIPFCSQSRGPPPSFSV